MANIDFSAHADYERSRRQFRKCEIGIHAVLEKLRRGDYNIEDAELAQEHIDALKARQGYEERNMRIYSRRIEVADNK